jgi:hypothetical protein
MAGMLMAGMLVVVSAIAVGALLQSGDAREVGGSGG